MSLFPVYEFRPHPDWRGPFFRYADGAWLPDDGEHDLAFAAPDSCMAYSVDLPYYENILWGWYVVHWSDHVREHPRGNAWHYALRDGATTWGDHWGRNGHPNTIACRAAMDYVASRRSCANGRGPEFHLYDPVISLGLLRVRDTKEVVVPPKEPVCMYCGLKWLAKESPHARPS